MAAGNLVTCIPPFRYTIQDIIAIDVTLNALQFPSLYNSLSPIDFHVRIPWPTVLNTKS